MPARTLTLLLVLLIAASAYGEVRPFEGTWEWVQTERADGRISTPATTGHTEQCCFSFGGTFTHFVDQEVAAEYDWFASEMQIGACLVETVSVAGTDWIWQVVGGEVRTLTLQTGFECPSGGGSPVEEIATLVERGPVAADARSWGAVKSLYR